MAKAKKLHADGKVQARVICAVEINGVTYKPDSVIEVEPALVDQYDELDSDESAVAYALSLGTEVVIA